MNVRVIVKVGTILLGVIALIGIGGCVCNSFRVRWQAEACLNLIRLLHVGSSTMEDANMLLKPFNRIEKDGTASIYGKPYQAYSYTTHSYAVHSYLIENKGLHLLGIFPRTHFEITLFFGDGLLVGKGASFAQDRYMPKAATYSADSLETIPGLMSDVPLAENPSGMILRSSGTPFRLEVLLDARASEADRKAAFDFDLGCFTSVFGCRSVYEILPGVEHHGAK